MKFQKAKEIYEKYLVLENIDPTLVSYYFCQQEFYLNQGIHLVIILWLKTGFGLCIQSNSKACTNPHLLKVVHKEILE